MHVSDRGGLLRARDRERQDVTAVELFFDLVFVFAVTQLSHRLLDVAVWETAASRGRRPGRRLRPDGDGDGDPARERQ